MEVSNPTLENISKAVDELWTARVTSIRKSNEALQPLVYSAWKLLFAGHRGRPKPGEESFSGWLEERKIPRRTGYKILNRERVKRGELNVPVGTIPVTEEDEELDVQESLVEAQKPAQEASVVKRSSDVSSAKQIIPETVPAAKPVLLKPRTPAERKTLIETLTKEFKRDLGNDDQAQAIIDDHFIQTLEMLLGYQRRKAGSKKSKANHADLITELSGAELQEAA